MNYSAALAWLPACLPAQHAHACSSYRLFHAANFCSGLCCVHSRLFVMLCVHVHGPNAPQRCLNTRLWHVAEADIRKQPPACCACCGVGHGSMLRCAKGCRSAHCRTQCSDSSTNIVNPGPLSSCFSCLAS
ncbi:hypothetical protein COO60DRAFT_25614 [Scenedesmus sp. NREL 46B-D3]|nr:hypothetical protein COO60DRAFT_25614 [Scenedesmus sp. NREL 46B-D3]